MHRRSIFKLLSDYPNSPWYHKSEKETLLHFIEFTQKNHDCFERSLREGHYTASCWLWNPDRTACLLTLHKKLGKWIQLGGHADGEPDLLKVSLKEAIEESGIQDIEIESPQIFDLSIHSLPPYKQDPAHKHYDVRFILRVKKNIPFTVSNESKELKWVPLDQFEDYTQEESVLRMRDKILNSPHYAL